MRPATIDGVATRFHGASVKLLNGSISDVDRGRQRSTADAMIPALGTQVSDDDPPVGGDLLGGRRRVAGAQFQAGGAVDGGAGSGGERRLADAQPEEVDLGADRERRPPSSAGRVTVIADALDRVTIRFSSPTTGV